MPDFPTFLFAAVINISIFHGSELRVSASSHHAHLVMNTPMYCMGLMSSQETWLFRDGASTPVPWLTFGPQALLEPLTFARNLHAPFHILSSRKEYSTTHIHVYSLPSLAPGMTTRIPRIFFFLPKFRLYLGHSLITPSQTTARNQSSNTSLIQASFQQSLVLTQGHFRGVHFRTRNND